MDRNFYFKCEDVRRLIQLAKHFSFNRFDFKLKIVRRILFAIKMNENNEFLL